MSTTREDELLPSAPAAGGLDPAASDGTSPLTSPLPNDPAGSFPPIGDLGLLSDGETTALIASNGNVEWMCLPDPDAPSVFAALVDRGAGRFRVGPSDVIVPAGQRYLLATMVIETTWMTPGGLLMVRDALILDRWRQEARTSVQHRPPGTSAPNTSSCAH